MCDFIVISTDSEEDLSLLYHKTACFSKDIGREPVLHWLKYPKLFRLYEKAHPCGCFFRVLDPNLGFIEPQDWLDEEQNDIENTHFAYQHIKRLVSDGYKVDCVSCWTTQQPNDVIINRGNIYLNDIGKDKFAFLFQSYFEYSN